MGKFILVADAKIQHNHKHPTTTPTLEPIEEHTNKERLCLYWDYHIDDIPCNKLRDLYNLHGQDTFANTLGIKQGRGYKSHFHLIKFLHLLRV